MALIYNSAKWIILLLALNTVTAWSSPTLPKEQIFGAELQYFRLRGGQGKNIPADKVYATWARALDAAKTARMNMISFYIPWDFHEYKEGQFDFDGTADEDGDGRADYPSRDLKTFFRMIEERGFQHVMVRPGPFINAEWGFLGFGAIPLWFHEKYPESHMQNSQGLRTKLYDYHNPDLLRHTELWFAQVYEQIIRPNLGPGKLIQFLQVDNETNFMWQSIYNHDYGPRAVARYQKFLNDRYGSLDAINKAHQRNWNKLESIVPPVKRDQNLSEDQDWYRFQDHSIFAYLQKIRAIWEKLGLKEPEVLFTLAESYNATNSGLIPNHHLRNDPSTGLLSVNLYPKTYTSPLQSPLNHPFKSDHDVVAQAAASERYLGAGNQWVMGPEIQGGWWKGIEVPTAARRQTYLSTIGHGMKAMLVYYFHEGQNWQSEWAKEQITPFYLSLKASKKYQDVKDSEIPQEFWNELQAEIDKRIVVGIDVKGEMTRDHAEAAELFFDAPLDGQGNPREHFADLQNIGENLIAPHAAWLGQAKSDFDPVCLLKDVADHVPNGKFDNVLVNTDWESGLVGYALNSGVNMRIVHWGIQTAKDLDSCEVIVRQDSGVTPLEISTLLKAHLKKGRVVVNLLENSLARELEVETRKLKVDEARVMLFSSKSRGAKFKATALYQYQPKKGCRPALVGEGRETYGYECRIGHGRFYQLGAQFYGLFNSDDYWTSSDLLARTHFLRTLTRRIRLANKTSVVLENQKVANRVVSFGRFNEGQGQRWITVKNGNSQNANVKVRWADAESGRLYSVKNLLGTNRKPILLNGDVLRKQGVPLSLNALESTVLWIEPQAKVARAN